MITKNKKVLLAFPCAVLLIAALLSGGCSQAANDSGPNPVTETGTGAITATNLSYSVLDYNHVKDEDLDDSWDKDSSTLITLAGDNISIAGSGAEADGSSLVITGAGTYVMTGTLTDGQITVEAPDDALVRIVLNGVTIHCEDSAAINCVSADKLILILAEGTENFVSDGDSYTFSDDENDEPNAAIFSKQDLTINGTGVLTVTADYNNGIGTKDDLILASGDIQVTARNHAIRGRDSVTVIDAALTLDAGNDGIQSNNDGEGKGWIALYGGSYTISAVHDGIQAESTLTIYDGEYAINTGGGSANAPQREETKGSGNWGEGRGDRRGYMGGMPDMDNADAVPGAANEAVSQKRADETEDTGEAAAADTSSESSKGLKAGGDLLIAGGSFTIDSADDAVHSNANVTISGGSFTISTGDDGVHADLDLLVEGDAVIDMITCYEGLEGTNVTVNGGDITINATDDGINAAGGSSNGQQTEGGPFGADSFSGGGDHIITINGGNIRVTAASDGLDSNGDILITGGEIYISAAGVDAAGGDGAIDCDGTFTITGGTVAGSGGTAFAIMGAGGSSINSGGTQPVLNFQFTETQIAGTVIELRDADGNVLVSHTADRDFKTIALSAPDMQDGESYTVYANGTEVYTVTLSGTMTSVSDTGESVSTGAGPGGMGGGGRRPDKGGMEGEL